VLRSLLRFKPTQILVRYTCYLSYAKCSLFIKYADRCAKSPDFVPAPVIHKKNEKKLERNVATGTKSGDFAQQGIGICWKNENYDWEIVNDESKVLENKLDTLKYKFNTSWEKDNFGIPNTKKYVKSNCGTIGLLNMKTYDKTIILEN
jgi:hypothetical protein